MAWASRSKRSLNCASENLIATSRFRRVSRARYTSPIPPAPRNARISYGPSFSPGESGIWRTGLSVAHPKVCSEGLGRGLPPVGNHVGVGPVEPIGMRTLHGDALRDRSIAARPHATPGIFAGQVDAGLYRRLPRRRETFASSQQLIKTLTSTRTTANRSELDVTRLLATFRSRSVQTDREAIENTARVSQDDVAGPLRQHSPYFPCEIEPLVNFMGKSAARLDG